MSLILKGIDLPTDRKPYAIEVTYRFEGADGLFSEEIFLSPNQAIQIPRGHGRIGDLDELQKAIRTDIMGGLNYEYFIRNAPTILDAEEK